MERSSSGSGVKLQATAKAGAQSVRRPSLLLLVLHQQVHLSLTKLTRGFSSFYGMPIHQYIIEQRLIQAAQLLLDGDRNVGEVATIVGYGKPSNFAAAFKKKYGVAPKNYRASRFSNSK